jgi:Tol biopolymer transport system component
MSSPKHADGALGLDGGIFNLADGSLAGRQFVSDRVIYANPAEGDLVPAAWSNDGTRVVFGDSQGSLTLVKADGTTQSLATNLPRGDWPDNVQYAWSPDDRHLLVQSGNRAWIVTVP